MGDVDQELLEKLSNNQPAARRRRAKPSQQTRRARKPTTTRRTTRASEQSEDSSYARGSYNQGGRGNPLGGSNHGLRYRDRRSRARRSHGGLPDDFDRFEAELDEEEKEEKEEDTGPTYFPPPYNPADDRMSLMVEIKSCSRLLPGNPVTNCCNAHVEVMMGDRKLHTTNVVEDTRDPIFREQDRNAFVFEIGGSEIYDQGGLFFFVYHENVKLGYASASARQVEKLGEKIELVMKPPGGRLSEKAGTITIAIRSAIKYVSEPLDLDTDQLQIKLNVVSYNCLAVPDSANVNPYAMIRFAGETIHETKPKPTALIGGGGFFRQDESNSYVLKTTCSELYSAGGIWFEVYDDNNAIGRAFVRSKALVLSTNESMCHNLELPPRREGSNGGYIRVQTILTDDKPEVEFKSFIEIKGCEDILAGDETTSDPYVCVKLGDKLLLKTKRRNKTLNPVYTAEHHNSFYLDTTEEQLRENGGLTFEVYDFDLVGYNDLLGTYVVPPDVLVEASGDLVYNLNPPEDRQHEPAGRIRFASTPVDHEKNHAASFRASKTSGDHISVFVEIDGCNNILVGDVTTSDPYIVASYQGKQIHKTKRRNKTLNPVYTKDHNNSFLLQTTKRELFENEGILLEIFDYDLIGDDDLLGSTNIPAGALQMGDGHLMQFAWSPPPDRADEKAGTVAIRCRPGEPGDPGYKEAPSTLADQIADQVGGAFAFASTTFASSRHVSKLEDDDDDDGLHLDKTPTFNAFDDEDPPPPPFSESPVPSTSKSGKSHRTKSPRREKSPHRTKSSPIGGSPKRLHRKTTGPERARSPRRSTGRKDPLRIASEHSPIRGGTSRSPDGSIRPKKEHGTRKAVPRHRSTNSSPKRQESVERSEKGPRERLRRTMSGQNVNEEERLSRSRSVRNMREEDPHSEKQPRKIKSGDGKVRRSTTKNSKSSGESRRTPSSSSPKLSPKGPKLSPKGKPRPKSKPKPPAPPPFDDDFADFD